MILLTQDYSCCLFAFAYIILSTATLATTQTLSSSSGDQFGLLPGSTEPEPQPEINTSLLDGSSQESALLVDYGDDGVTNVLPPLNIPVPDIFPIRFPKFIDPTGLLRWLRKPQKSNCDNGKSLFCCQLGPPRPLLDPNTPYESPERLAERQTRMRECVPWSEEEPACHFLENLGCCDCRSIELKTAFGCYLPVWRDNPDYINTVYPGPMRLPKVRMPPKRPRKSRARPKPGQEETPDVVPDGGQDPNPSEPDPSSDQELPGQKKKREWSPPPDSGDMGTTPNTLYAAKPHPKTRPVQADPDDPRCSDEYLAKVGLRSFKADPERVREPQTTPLSSP